MPMLPQRPAVQYTSPKKMETSTSSHSSEELQNGETAESMEKVSKGRCGPVFSNSPLKNLVVDWGESDAGMRQSPSKIQHLHLLSALGQLWRS